MAKKEKKKAKSDHRDYSARTPGGALPGEQGLCLGQAFDSRASECQICIMKEECEELCSRFKSQNRIIRIKRVPKSTGKMKIHEVVMQRLVSAFGEFDKERLKSTSSEDGKEAIWHSYEWKDKCEFIRLKGKDECCFYWDDITGEECFVHIHDDQPVDLLDDAITNCVQSVSQRMKASENAK